MERVAFGLVVFLLAAPAASLDLTGTWLGKFTCSVYDGEPDRFLEPSEILQISQQGNELRVLWVDAARLTGVALADAERPDTKGEVALTDCTTGPDLFTQYAELARLSARVNREKGSGSLRGFSIYAPSGVIAGSCSWRFRLADPTDPVVGGCP